MSSLETIERIHCTFDHQELMELKMALTARKIKKISTWNEFIFEIKEKEVLAL